MRLVRVALVCLPLFVFTACPEPVSDPCENVNCGAGRCIPTNGQPACLCDTTYVAQGLTCVPMTTAEACANNPCAATGKVCSAVNGQPSCSCPTGYVDSGAGCVKANPCNPNPCTAANQSCQAQNGAALCVCNAGYTPVGNGCSSEPVFDCNKQHAGGSADDQYEPNECPTLSTAYDLTAAAQNHTLGPAGDEDWIRISPEVGHIIGVEFASSTIPLYVDVYGEDGITPIASDHRGVNNPSFRFVAATQQTHYLRIRALRANDVGSYTLTISDTGVDDFTNQVTSALTVASGGTFSGEVQYTGDVDVISMPVQANHIYRLLLSTTSATGLVVEVLAADGTTLRKTMDRTLTTNTSHTVFSKTDTTVYLRAKAESVGSVGAFSVTLTDLGTDDHGDLVLDATSITPSSTMQSGMFETRVTGAPVDIDVFTFTAQAGHIYALTCGSGTSNYGCTAAARDALGAVIAQMTGGSTSAASKTMTFEVQSAGTYNVSIQPYSTSSYYQGAVSWKLEDLGSDDFGDDRASASALTLGTPKTGRIETAADLDYFSFSGTATHVYQVGCVPDTTLTYCTVRVLNASGTVIATSTSTGQTSFEAQTSETFYVEAKAYYSTYTGSYTLSVTDAGTDDHGDSDATATALTVGTAKAGSIELSGDLDVFSFSATAQNIYSVSCTSASSYGCYLTVRDGSGVTVTSTSYGSNTSTGFRATSTGTYYVQVRAYSTYTATYSLTVSSSGADDHPDTATGATSVTPGTAKSGDIQFAYDKDFFQFSATAGKLYKVGCTSTAYYVCVMTVRNPAGTSVASTTYGTARETQIFEATTAGAYTVEVGGYSTYTGAYSLTVTDEGQDDHGDTATAATTLTPGAAAANGRIELSYDYDFFSFTATANKIYRFTCTSTTSYMCTLTARDPAGLSVSSTSYGTSRTVQFVAAQSGVYTLEVRGYSSYTGSYTYQLFDDGSDDHGGTAATATALTVGTATNGNLQFTADRDFFKFTATQGRIYKAACATSATYLCMLSVRDPSGTVVASSSYGTATSAMWEALVAGTFTVETYAYSSTYTGAYTMTVTDEGTEDHGDTMATATSITAGAAAANGKIESQYDVDYFSFSGTQNNIYRFTCTSTVSYQCVLAVKNAAGTNLATTSYGLSRTVTFTAPATGTYYVEVKAYSSYTGTYTYQLFDDGADDYGDTAAAATTTVTVPSTTSGNLQFTNDRDVFKFTATAGRLYTFTCTSSDSYGCYMVARDGSGVSLGTSSYGSSVSFTVKANTAGTFALEVASYYGYTGTWSVAIAETTDDHGDTQATSTGISTGTAVSGVLEYAGDYDYFAVNLNANQTYSFNIGSSPTIYAYFIVYNSAGTTVLSESYTQPRSYTPTVAGTYYVRVRPYSASYLGNYTLTVQ